MIRAIGVTVFGSLASRSFAATCAVDGSSYEYAEAVSGDTRTVTFNVCPNHYFDMGKLNPNYAISGDETYTMPSSPMLESSSTYDLSGQGGSVGVLFNGAYLFSAFAGPNYPLTGYSKSATYLEGDTFEKCGCHSSSSSSAGYHCHIPPSCLLHQLGETTTDHSPQVGWAPDGFPVYGPRGPTGALIKLCSESTNTDTTNCLDECSGLEMELADVDNFTYRYYMTGEDFLDGSNSDDPLDGSDPINPLSTEPYYPFTPICYRGCCPSGVTCSGSSATIPSCSGSATAGTTSSYSATATWPTGLEIYGGSDGTPSPSPSPSPSASPSPSSGGKTSGDSTSSALAVARVPASLMIGTAGTVVFLGA